jgi:hypothetical protein
VMKALLFPGPAIRSRSATSSSSSVMCKRIHIDWHTILPTSILSPSILHSSIRAGPESTMGIVLLRASIPSSHGRHHQSIPLTNA